MSGAGRITDKATDGGGGTASDFLGSASVKVNDRPALRLGDRGCDSVSGAPAIVVGAARAVFANGVRMARTGDGVKSTSGVGCIVSGSPSVCIGDLGNPPKDKTQWPGIHLKIRCCGKLIHNVKYELQGAENRTGTVVNGKIDERFLKDGEYKLLVNGHPMPLRRRNNGR